MTTALASLCARHGIECSYVGFDDVERRIPDQTLAALAEALGAAESEARAPGTIADALAEQAPARCHVPPALENARVWGLTCQLPGLVSDRNLGMGDFADLAELCRIAGAEGADFLGLNPLHALFWSDPARISPFFPSNRSFLNPLYLAPDWIDGFDGLSEREEAEAKRLRQPALVEPVEVAALKQPILRRLFDRFPWTDAQRAAFEAFRAGGGPALESHALFEALSAAMAAEGHHAGWTGWPPPFRDRHSPQVRSWAGDHRHAVDFHAWLQWQAQGQLGRVQQAARDAGMRVGLYLDFAVGAAPDGSAAWSDPELTVPGLSIGAPPDGFSVNGQDWGLAPLSPVRLAEADGAPLGQVMRSVLPNAGAIRIDHAMNLARLWLIPRGAPPTAGAYVRYPLSRLLDQMARASQEARAMVIGEDLGVVPKGFRPLMAQRAFHAYKVLFFERSATAFDDPRRWPADALACLGTHDMPTFQGWWSGHDLELRRDLGMLGTEHLADERDARARDRQALLRLMRRDDGDPARLSPVLHGVMAASPCRLAALQIEDALGLTEQVNVPGTVDEHPNWRRRLPVPLSRLAGDEGFQAHAEAMRRARPRAQP